MFQIGLGASKIFGRVPYHSIPAKSPFDLYFDAQRGGFKHNDAHGNSLSSLITDTHAQPIYVPDGNGGIVERAANVLSVGSEGLQTVPTRTNLFIGSALPGTNWGTASPGLSLTSEIDAAKAAPNGVLGVRKYTVTASDGSQLRFGSTSAGTPGLDYSGSCYICTADGSTITVKADINDEGQGTFQVGPTWTRIERRGAHATQPYRFFDLAGFTSGSKFYLWGVQIEEGSFTTPLIPTVDATVTREGNRQVIDLTDKLSYGVAGIVKVDLKASLSENNYAFLISDGSTTNRVGLVGVAGKLQFTVGVNNVSHALINMGVMPLGVSTIAFAATTNFATVRIVGGSNLAPDTEVVLPPLSTVSIGGTFLNGQSYQMTKKLGLVFGSPTKPINQALFDQIYALAELEHVNAPTWV